MSDPVPPLQPVADRTRAWVNFWALPSGERNFADAVGKAGNQWADYPQPLTPNFRKLDVHHGDFERMMRAPVQLVDPDGEVSSTSVDQLLRSVVGRARRP